MRNDLLILHPKMNNRRIFSTQTLRRINTLDDCDFSTLSCSLKTNSSVGVVTFSSDHDDILNPGHVIRDRWKIVKKIASGGFGEVYEAEDLKTESMVAIKLEPSGSKELLKMEVGVLKKLQNHVHVCKYFAYGRAERYSFVVMELQGKNLGELRKERPNQRFSLGTTLLLGYQVLDAIHCLHQNGFLHRDIKPSNFAIGYLPENKRKVYMLDFGLARQYRNAEGNIKCPRINVGFRGTPRYASVNAHNCKELGRHDDLWSFFYMLCEFVEGKLPWKEIKARKKIGLMKEEFDHQELIKHFPKDFRKFLDHLEGLSYYDEPNYNELRSILAKCMSRRGVKETDEYDWERKVCTSAITLIPYEAIIPRDYDVMLSAELSEELCIQKEDERNCKNKLRALSEKNAFAKNSSVRKEGRQVNECSTCKENIDKIHKSDDYNGHIKSIPLIEIEDHDVGHASKECHLANAHSMLKSESKDVSLTHAIADDASVIQLVTNGGGPALTLDSKLQCSFDISEEIGPEVKNCSLQDNFQKFQKHLNDNFLVSKFKKVSKSGISLEKKDCKMLNRDVYVNGKRKRPVCRSMSQPAKFPPNVTVRNISTADKKSKLLHLCDEPVGDQTQGLPRCWSCPTISLHIRSHLKPPLKQQASFDENVYEVDVMRNVAAKQKVNEQIILKTDERRTSLPSISVADSLSKENVMCSTLENKENISENKAGFKDGNQLCIAALQNDAFSERKNHNVCDVVNSLNGENILQKNLFLIKSSSDKSLNSSVNGIKLQRNLSSPSVTGQRIYLPEQEHLFPRYVDSKSECTVNGRLPQDICMIEFDIHDPDFNINKNSLLSSSAIETFSYSSEFGINAEPEKCLENNSVYSLQKKNSGIIWENTHNLKDLRYCFNEMKSSEKIVSALHSSKDSTLSESVNDNNACISENCQSLRIPVQVHSNKKGSIYANESLKTADILHGSIFVCPSNSRILLTEEKINLPHDHVFTEDIDSHNKNINTSTEQRYLGHPVNHENYDKKPLMQRRQRANPDCKYVDERESKLNYIRRRQRPESMLCRSTIQNPFQESDQNITLHNKSNDIFHNFVHKNLEHIGLNNKLNLYLQAQKTENELPQPPPGKPPSNYCLPSRRLKYKVQSVK